MIRIEYCALGEAVNDFHLEEWLEKAQRGGTFSVSSQVAVDRVRLAIAEGNLPHQGVEFVFHGERLTPDADGILNRWPEGFCDLHEKLARRHLEAMVSRTTQKAVVD